MGSVHVLPFHPLDVVGWDGCLYPYVFNVRDFEPITGRVHQPPPVHQVFEGMGFVVYNFVPRKVDYHPLSIPVPYYHSNVDSDEIMFYVDGDYEARKGSGIGRGSISVHPGGTRTDRSRARPRARSAWSTSTSWPSWWTRSGRWSSVRPGSADDGAYALSWSRGVGRQASGQPGAARSGHRRRPPLGGVMAEPPRRGWIQPRLPPDGARRRAQDAGPRDPAA